MSAKQRFWIRSLVYFPLDLYDWITGKRMDGVPKRALIYTGSTADAKSYVRQSVHQLMLLQKTISLKPTDDVLDVGSGIGRTALALKDYLNQNARYEGFDVVELGVNWCKKHISRKYPNFQFTYVALANDLYNSVQDSAANFTFPYSENSFDKTFSFSVFTHMQPDEIANYLSEISRVLRPGGLTCNTFFIYDDDSEKISLNENFQFDVKKPGYRLMSERVKASNVALSRSLLQQIVPHDMEVVDIIEGYWRDPSKYEKKLEFQDIVVMRKL